MDKLKYNTPSLVGQKHEKTIGYRLRLANGHEWNLLSSEEVTPWLQKLAGIMQLKTHELNGSPKLIFHLRGEDLDPTLRQGLPKKGWKEHDIKSVKFWFHPKHQDVICEIGDDETHELSVIRMWQALAPIYRKVQEDGGFPFHCGFVAKDGKGVLLAAPGNTGKSTCCRRIPSPWEAMSDDEAVIVLNDKKEYMAHPFPTWSNFLWKRDEGDFRMDWNSEKAIPLKAIFFLEQSEVESVETVGQGQAAIFMNESATQVCRRSWRKLDPDVEKRLKRKIFENACEMAKAIPAYILKVSLNGKFWEKIEEVLA